VASLVAVGMPSARGSRRPCGLHAKMPQDGRRQRTAVQTGTKMTTESGTGSGQARAPGPLAGARRQVGTRKRLSSAQRRALIMEAAARTFAERGYSGASMTDIAAAAGIAPSVIYDHFASKRDLHLELLTKHVRELIEATTQNVEGSGEALLRRGTEAFFRFVEQHPYAWRMLFRDPPADDEIAAAHSRIHQHGAAAIADLLRRGPVLDMPESIPRERVDEMLARAIKSVNDGLAAWWYEHPEVPREQVVAVSMALCWRGLAALTGTISPPGA
jgi:AcrR family transcriptional regulator